MSEYQRKQARFAQRGVDLNHAVDDIPDDKLAIATNVRPTQRGTLTTRPAIAAFLSPGSGEAVHSLKSFNAGGLNRTFSGSSAQIYMDADLVDTGYSGNPLMWASYQPSVAVQPFLYASDSARYSKFRASDGARFPVGTPPPGVEPYAEIAPGPLYSVVDDFENASGWTPSVGASFSAFARVPSGITVSGILFDSFGTPPAGWACVTFSVTSGWLAKGIRISVGSEWAVVSDLIPAAFTGSATIANIAYDSGTNGACCIVLSKSTLTLRRNALLKIGTEYVRVLSVSVGDDNSVSFRCVTLAPHAAGASVAAYDCARMYFASNHANGDFAAGGALALTADNSHSAISVSGVVSTNGTAVTWTSGYFFNPTAPPALGSWTGATILLNGIPYTIASVPDARNLILTSNAGIQTLVPYTVSPSQIFTMTKIAALDLSQISGRAVMGEDWLHISLMCDNPQTIALLQILVDVDATTNDFAHNYYWAEITQNFLTASASGSASVANAQAAAVSQAQTQQQAIFLTPAIAAVEAAQLATGANAWTEVFIPVSKLLAGRVGTDQTRTLANVAAIQIRVGLVPSSVSTVSVDSWWIGGTYGANCPESLYPDNPLKYCFRFRSTSTGAQSTWSPLSRGGVFPERMQVIVAGPGSDDSQVDTVDIARVGASIDGTPQEIGSFSLTVSSESWTFIDDFSDAQLGDQIAQTDFQPWPVQQNPIVGTCSVVGTSVFSTSVSIPAKLCAGTLVLVNGAATTIRGAPGANSFQVEDTLAPGSGLSFQINSPTTYGNPLPYLAGPFDETFFAAGDSINPGRVYFTNRTNPETANAKNFVDLTSSSEPLLGLCVFNGYVVPMTGERFFAGSVTNDSEHPYAFADTSVGCGLFTPWCYDTGPMIFFVSKSGVMATDLGPAKSLTEEDLYPFLPHEGLPGVSVNGYFPPDMNYIPRLTYTRNGWLYLDFVIDDLTIPTPSVPFTTGTPIYRATFPATTPAQILAGLHAAAVACAWPIEAITGGERYRLVSPQGLMCSVSVQDLTHHSDWGPYLTITFTSADGSHAGLPFAWQTNPTLTIWANACSLFGNAPGVGFNDSGGTPISAGRAFSGGIPWVPDMADPDDPTVECWWSEGQNVDGYLAPGASQHCSFREGPVTSYHLYACCRNGDLFTSGAGGGTDGSGKLQILRPALLTSLMSDGAAQTLDPQENPVYVPAYVVWGSTAGRVFTGAGSSPLYRGSIYDACIRSADIVWDSAVAAQVGSSSTLNWISYSHQPLRAQSDCEITSWLGSLLLRSPTNASGTLVANEFQPVPRTAHHGWAELPMGDNSAPDTPTFNNQSIAVTNKLLELLSNSGWFCYQSSPTSQIVTLFSQGYDPDSVGPPVPITSGDGILFFWLDNDGTPFPIILYNPITQLPTGPAAAEWTTFYGTGSLGGGAYFGVNRSQDGVIGTNYSGAWVPMGPSTTLGLHETLQNIALAIQTQTRWDCSAFDTGGPYGGPYLNLVHKMVNLDAPFDPRAAVYNIFVGVYGDSNHFGAQVHPGGGGFYVKSALANGRTEYILWIRNVGGSEQLSVQIQLITTEGSNTVYDFPALSTLNDAGQIEDQPYSIWEFIADDYQLFAFQRDYGDRDEGLHGGLTSSLLISAPWVDPADADIRYLVFGAINIRQHLAWPQFGYNINTAVVNYNGALSLLSESEGTSSVPGIVGIHYVNFAGDTPQFNVQTKTGLAVVGDCRLLCPIRSGETAHVLGKFWNMYNSTLPAWRYYNASISGRQVVWVGSQQTRTWTPGGSTWVEGGNPDDEGLPYGILIEDLSPKKVLVT